MEERLINAVANHPELYNTSCFLYRDRNKKDRAWRKICEAGNLYSIAFCSLIDKSGKTVAPLKVAVIQAQLLEQMVKLTKLLMPPEDLMDPGAATIRLAGSGSTPCSGRVEVYHNDSWGTVCDDGWDLNDAEVVCRELNCGMALEVPPSANFGAGTGQIWLDHVTCSGNESSLTECQHSGFGSNTCERGQDAAVICSGEKQQLFAGGLWTVMAKTKELSEDLQLCIVAAHK
ncbi:hypothetical protein ACER0C_001251 [Sarotherodon galilaeus]